MAIVKRHTAAHSSALVASSRAVLAAFPSFWPSWPRADLSLTGPTASAHQAPRAQELLGPQAMYPPPACQVFVLIAWCCVHPVAHSVFGSSQPPRLLLPFPRRMPRTASELPSGTLIQAITTLVRENESMKVEALAQCQTAKTLREQITHLHTDLQQSVCGCGVEEGGGE